jgi:hypothetical protein
MAVYQTPHYEKPLFSDLLNSWTLLKQSVENEHRTKDCSQLLLYITAAMSWECVQNLRHMKNTFLLVQNIAQQIGISDETAVFVDDVEDILSEALDRLKKTRLR